jgi:hypothetical protein
MYGLISLGAVFVAVAAMVLATAAPAKPRHKPKHPDLIVKTLPLQGQPYALNGDVPSDKTTFEFLVDNNTNVPLGKKTRAKVELVHSVHGAFPLGHKEIQDLPAHQAEQVKATTPVLRGKAGAYRVRACADVGDHASESNERNNCAFFKLSDKHFYVANKHYRGSLAGMEDRSTQGGWLESWSAPTVDFGPAVYKGHGHFSYNLSGTVYYADSNSPGPGQCPVTGSGAGAVTGSLQLSFDFSDYFGLGSAAASYPIYKCGNNDDGDMGPTEPGAFDTTNYDDPAILPTLEFGNHIGGSTSNGPHETWNWSLDGADG